ncbi:DNRLRE domain-containing protein [Herbidospora galbida]|uniref:DNRLRE domain-containing protein n=1 Tax=Herbidospora galbida TaxID=2575442 RepID=A0A4U3MNS4_9ACTN|nr:DNRLRE domain-containing protein [Herbidospora galbida]TKK90352.1 DNRLRE domain-containing protein [Herbidospora galbida]
MIRVRSRIAGTALAVVVSMFVSTIGVPDGLVTAASAAELPEPMTEPSVEGRPVAAATVVKGAEDAPAEAKPPAPVWPKAGSADLVVPAAGAQAVAAAGLPVKISAPGPLERAVGGDKAPTQEAKRIATAAAPAKVRVESLGRDAAAKAGGVGVALRLSRADGGGERAPVTVSVDYSAFRGAGKRGSASFLTLVEQPVCVLETPLTDDCRLKAAGQRRQLPVVNDVKAGTLTTVAEAGSGESVLAVAQAAAATDGSSSGSFAVTDLKPAGDWQVGLSGGAFSYSYPIAVPPPLAGKAPDLALSYSSSTVDGMTSLTNNQSSAAGLGWDLETSYIEQSFYDCEDWCWDTGSAEDWEDTSVVHLTMSLAGVSTKIVKDKTSGTWKTVEDHGWKIEQIASGAESAKPYWKITTQDGTVYRLGYRRDASLQIPYFAPEPGQPCHQYWVELGEGYASTVCTAPYRWMLDQEVDPRGNVIDYAYQRGTDAYCSNRRQFSNCWLDYDTSAVLSSISYGWNVNVAGSAPTARVQFGLSSRVIGGDSDLPDWDLCNDFHPCGDNMMFYLDKRITSITTQVAAGAGWADVTRYDLTHKYVQSPDELMPVLWLDQIKQTGLAGNGPDIALPPVKFTSVLQDNLYNIFDYGRSRLPRLSAIDTELGGRTEITYGLPSGCDLETTSNPDTRDDEGNDCYWIYQGDVWEGNGFVPAGSIWLKYVVTKVTDKDLVGGSPDLVTSYQYVGTPGWTRPERDPRALPSLVPQWTRYRGYPTVRVLKGTGTDPAGYTATSSTFFRGMYEDRIGGFGLAIRGTQVTDFEGNSFPDRKLLAGKPLMQQTLRVLTMSGSTPSTFAEEGGARYEYQIVSSGNGPDADDPAYVNQTKHSGREKVTSGWRYSDKVTTYDSDALPIRVNDYGQRGLSSDNVCTSTTYAKNTSGSAWMISYRAAEERRKGDDCTSGEFMGRTVTLYDGATSEATNAPTKGTATQNRSYTSVAEFTSTKVTYDGYGRTASSTDPLNKTTTTTYAPAIGWPTGGVAVTNPLGQTTSTWANPEFGQPIGTRNEAGYDTNIDYDALGRTVALWTPAQPKTGGVAAAIAAYVIPVDASGVVNGPVRTALSKLQTASTYVTTYTYDDGLGRARETQVASPAGGRIVSATVYDSRGLTSATGSAVHNSAAPGSGLLNAAMTTLPQWTKQIYDGVGRVVVSADMTGMSELRRTTTNYYGDRTEEIPPVGGKTVSYTDAEDKVTKIEEWLTGAGTAPAALQGPALTQAASSMSSANRAVTGRTLLDDRTTIDSQTFRNPDGTFTTEYSSGPVRVKQTDGNWAAIDTTLVEVGGVLKPKVSAATVELSAGGQGTLARLEGMSGERFALQWPSTLPKPQVNGNVATYVDAAGPGADLVVTALSSGFRHDVVLRKPPAQAMEYRLPVVAEGMTLTASAQGALALKDGNGRTTASAPAPVMWDSSGKRGRTGKISTQVVNDSGKQVLVLRPDPAFLDDKATVYPVTVDPTTTLPNLTDTWIGTTGPDGADVQSDPDLYAGSYESFPGFRTYERTYLNFNTASLAGTTVTAATLTLRKLAADGCGDSNSGIRAQRVTGSWTSGGITWSGQPALTTTDQVTTKDTSCSTTGTMSWNVLPFAQAWASGTANYGIMLRGVDETTSRPLFDRGFHSNETTSGSQNKPALSVTYTPAGSTPAAADLAVAPFRTVSGTTTATSLTPQLAATVSDPYGGTLTGEFEVEHDLSVPAQGSGQIWSGSAAGITAGQSAAVVVPGLQQGWLVRWRARAVNPGQSTTSDWSSWQTLRIDPTAAQAPTSTPIAHWKFDGNGGEATGTSGRTATLGGTASWTTGVFGGALEASGGANSASTPTWVMRTDQSFTISAWMRVENANGWYEPIRQEGTNKPPFYMGINPSGQLQMVLNASDTAGAIAYGTWSGSYPIKRWFHITGVYDKANGRVRVYRDGVEQGNNTVPMSGFQGNGQVKFGANYTGQIDDVRVYQKVLSATEIAAIAAGSPAPDRTPVADQFSATSTTTLTPTLSARVSEPGGQVVRAEFQAEHDGTQVWTGAKDNVTSGSTTTIQIPSGTLQDGWEVRWRARAVRGDTSSAWGAWQTFTVNTPKPTVSALQLTPSTLVSGQTVTSTVTPLLKATLTDPGGAAVRAEFEVEQPHGTSAWTGNVATVTSGGQASITVPAGELVDGVAARWRVRAVNPNGNVTGSWSSWQDFAVDTPDPAIGNLQTDPSVVSGTETITQTLTPNLRATVSEPGNGQVKAEFEVEHDGQQIWTDTSGDLASGAVASVGVPSGELSNGWTVRWRARAVTVATAAISAWSDWQTVKVQTEPIDPAPAVGALQITPSELVAGERVTSSVTPTLAAQVSDAAGGTLRTEFEIEHDGTQVWTGADADTPAGQQASIAVPAGELTDGWTIRWRARALNGTIASDWSAWQDVRIDRPDPTVSDLSATESLTPELKAKVVHPDGGTLSAEFEVEHDPSVPAQGTGQIWAGADNDVPSGQTATVTTSAMTEGWKVRWRVRAVTADAGTSAWSAWQPLTVTDGTSIPTVSGPRTQPADFRTLTPALIATFTAGRGQVDGEFQVEHDPTATAQGTGLIWSGDVTGATSGKEAAVTVPSGLLQDGWKIRWRTRAVRGAAASDWTSWKTGMVDAPEFYTTTFEYDLAGNLTKQTDANGNVRISTYDLLGRRTSVEDPDSGTTRQGYDASGRVQWTIDGNGQKMSYEYDDIGRKISQWVGELEGGEKVTEWLYDTLQAGQLTSATQYNNGSAYTQAAKGYDSSGRSTGTTFTIPSTDGQLAGTYEFTTTYTTSGDIATRTMPEAGGLPAETLTSTYTNLGLADRLTSDFGGGFTYVDATGYSSIGQMVTRNQGAGGKVKRTLFWDQVTGWLNRLTTVKDGNTSTPVLIQDDQLEYAPSGEILSVLDATQAVSGNAGQSECFSYDGTNRLVRAFTTTASCTTGFDGQGYAPYEQRYAYDGTGNITSRESDGALSTYIYPALGGSVAHPNAVAAISGEGVDTYTYDSSGNLSARTVGGQAATFAWNSLNQVETAATGTGSIEMVYGPDGNRLLRRSPDGTTTLYLGDMEVTARGSQVTANRNYVSSDGSLIAIRSTNAPESGGVTWMATGTQKSVQIAVSDASGQLSRVRYLPYGERRGQTKLAFSDRGFLGKVEDSGSALVLLSARFYDPTIGRFISPDPLVASDKPQWANAYSYAANNPIGMSDPSGLFPDPCAQMTPTQCYEFKSRNHYDGKSWVANRPATAPFVTNPSLKAILENDGIYARPNKTYPNGVVGDGTVAEGLKYEFRSGQRINGIFHAQKAASLAARLSKLLDEDRAAGGTLLSASDRKVAMNEFGKIWKVLTKERDRTGNVTASLKANPNSLKSFTTTVEKSMERSSVKRFTGEKFTYGYAGKPIRVPRTSTARWGGFLTGIGKIGNALGFVGIFYDAWQCSVNNQCPYMPGQPDPDQLMV